MISHLSLGVTDLARAVQFYDAALGALGYERVWTGERAAGYGSRGGQDVLALKWRDGASPPGPGFHLAFAADSRAAVDRFHETALAHGGTTDGAPGLRPHYGPAYYAAFIRDPDGYAIEAVNQ